MSESQAGASTESTPSTTSSPASAPVSAPQSSPAPSASPEASPSVVTKSGMKIPTPSVSSPEAIAAPAAYTPNYKFNILEKEHEFDEVLRPLIKDINAEKKIRELYEKAHGIEFVKTNRDKYRSDLEKISNEHKGLTKTVQQLGSLMRSNDMNDVTSFFENLKVPESKIFAWVKHRLELQQMEPAKRQEVEQFRASQLRAQQLEEENRNLQSRYQNAEVNSLEKELRFVMASPEVKTIAERYDHSLGQGSFWNDVAQEGDRHWKTTGQVLPPEEAVKKVVDKINRLWGPTAQPSEHLPAQPAAAVSPENVPQEKKPIIPNIQGRGTSPTKKVITSTQALRELAKSKLSA